MNVMKIAQAPPPAVSVWATVLEAVRVMQQAGRGAAIVVCQDCLEGIITERDVMLRVVASARDPHSTVVGDVMTSPVRTLTAESSTCDAFELMFSCRVRHLPVVDVNGKPVGLVSIRDLLDHYVGELAEELDLLKDWAGLR